MTQSSQDKRSETDFWDRVASQRVYAAFDKEEYEELIDRVWGPDLAGVTIADIGSASGVSAALFSVRGADVVGIEISPELVNQATLLWQEHADHLEFRVGDAENLSIDDASVDAVFFGGVLHHIPQLHDVYAEALRVLRPGGKFVAIEPNRLDFLELLEWSVADLRGKLSPNEYPIDPLLVQRELAEIGFVHPRFWTTRHDIPVLAQVPVLGGYFDRHHGFAVKNSLLRLINAFRAPERRGTFFVMVAEKP